ncbi:MAG TPA: PQQ-binding-like beta-propeller repeat protein, partial [Terriglobales bacterium]|nr:PQQ-binding-like beta-propeller repeat protein [Terriglobales bacterium]
GASSQLQGWRLDSGTQLFHETLPGDYPVMQAAGGVLVLQSEREVRLLDASSGAERWRVESHEGALAAIAPASIIFWEDGGSLIALARRNGALLWRVRFQSF